MEDGATSRTGFRMRRARDRQILPRDVLQSQRNVFCIMDNLYKNLYISYAGEADLEKLLFTKLRTISRRTDVIFPLSLPLSISPYIEYPHILLAAREKRIYHTDIFRKCFVFKSRKIIII